MPPISDEHNDELRARRLRREGRRGPPAANGNPPGGGQSAGAARDLLRGLITDGARNEGDGASATTRLGVEDEPAAPASPDRPPERALGARGESEKIDELIRRVKARAETSSPLQPPRPKGTADLSRHTAMSRAGARQRAPKPHPHGTDVVPKLNQHRRAVAATVLLTAITTLIATLAGVGGTSVPRGADSSLRRSPLATVRPDGFAGALDATIAAIGPELRAITTADPAAQRARAVSLNPSAATSHGGRRKHSRLRKRRRSTPTSRAAHTVYVATSPTAAQAGHPDSQTTNPNKLTSTSTSGTGATPAPTSGSSSANTNQVSHASSVSGSGPTASGPPAPGGPPAP